MDIEPLDLASGYLPEDGYTDYYLGVVSGWGSGEYGLPYGWDGNGFPYNYGSNGDGRGCCSYGGHPAEVIPGGVPEWGVL